MGCLAERHPRFKLGDPLQLMMIRLTRTTIVALTLAVLPGAACNRDDPSPPEMRAVPAEAIGTSVGPDQAVPIVTDTDHTSVYAFDAAGTLLDRSRVRDRPAASAELETRVHCRNSRLADD